MELPSRRPDHVDDRSFDFNSQHRLRHASFDNVRGQNSTYHYDYDPNDRPLSRGNMGTHGYGSAAHLYVASTLDHTRGGVPCGTGRPPGRCRLRPL